MVSFNRRVVKVVINIVAMVSFLFNIAGGDLVLAKTIPIESGPFNKVTNNGLTFDSNLTDILIPLQLGEIKNTFKGTNGKTIIHIQDAHCNYAAQTSIRGIIRSLTAAYSNIDLLSLEGGMGNYDLSVFTDIKDPDIREKVIDYLMKEGRMSGPEAFAVNDPGKVKLFGIEDEKLYKENLEAYRSSLSYKEEAGKYLNIISTAITALKIKIYSSVLKELDDKITAYKNNETDFKDYALFLIEKSRAGKIDIKIYETLNKFISIINDEKNINFKEADIERGKLIDKISAKVSKSDFEELVTKSVTFKSGGMTSDEFYAYIFKKARFSGVDFSTLPNLVKYSEYIKRYEALNKTAIFNEIKGLENALMTAMADTGDQQALYSLDRDLTIIREMLNISLIKEEFDYYLANKSNFSIKKFIDFINTKASLYGLKFRLNDDVDKLDAYRENMEKFYDYSLKRDGAFIANIEKKLKDEKEDVTILVTGGFHTGNLSELFKNKGYSYIEVMPKFENTDVENPYFRLLSGEETQFETILKNAISYKPEISNIAIESLYSEMPVDYFKLHNIQKMRALKERAITKVMSQGHCVIKQKWGYVVIESNMTLDRMKKERGAISGFETSNGETSFTAGFFIAPPIGISAIDLDEVIIFRQDGKWTLKQQEEIIDQIGISIGTDDIDNPEMAELKRQLSESLKNDLGLNEKETAFIFSHKIKIWKDKMPVFGHPGRHEIFLSPELYDENMLKFLSEKSGRFNQYEALAVVLVHEILSTHGIKHSFIGLNTDLADRSKKAKDGIAMAMDSKRYPLKTIYNDIKRGALKTVSADPEDQELPDTMKVNLKNGAIEELGLVKSTISAVRTLHSGLLYELYAKARNPQHKFFPISKKELEALKLVQKDGNLHDSVRNIILSAIEGNEPPLKLVPPIDQKYYPVIYPVLKRALGFQDEISPDEKYFTPADWDTMKTYDQMISEQHPKTITDDLKKGQEWLIDHQCFPVSGTSDENEWTAMGIKLGEISVMDTLFRNVTLPDGWKIIPSKYVMWNYLIDGQGTVRAGIFFKAAYADRRAFIRLLQDHSESERDMTMAIPSGEGLTHEPRNKRSSTLFDASEMAEARNIEDLKEWIERLKAEGTDLHEKIYPDFLQCQTATFNIGVTEWEWDHIKSSLYGSKAAAGAYFMKHSLGKMTINFFVKNKEGIARIKKEMVNLDPETKSRTITFAYTDTDKNGAPLMIKDLEEMNCLKVVYLNGKDGEVATPVQGCFQQGIRILNYEYLLRNKETTPAQLLESAIAISRGMSALSGAYVNDEDIQAFANEIIEKGINNVIFFVKLRPVDINAIAAFHIAEAEVLRSL